MLNNIINRDDLYPSVLVSVRAPMSVFGKSDIRDSLSVVEWHMPASINPMGYAISVKRDDNIRSMISSAGNFVVNFMGHDQKSIVLSCEGQDGAFIDLFDFLGLSKSDSESVESPRIGEAKAVLECEVISELDSGDHTIFLGRVLGSKS
jgi:flavin reductase (DIM6/NTAB) family NADH-FMN oxidoreductase RutF